MKFWKTSTASDHLSPCLETVGKIFRHQSETAARWLIPYTRSDLIASWSSIRNFMGSPESERRGRAARDLPSHARGAHLRPPLLSALARLHEGSQHYGADAPSILVIGWISQA